MFNWDRFIIRNEFDNCINNICYDYTEDECSFYANSIWHNRPCNDINCCLETGVGACCLGEMCYETTAQKCVQMERSGDSERPGIFWGIGSSCAGPYRNTGAYSPHECVFDENGAIIGP